MGNGYLTSKVPEITDLRCVFYGYFAVSEMGWSMVTRGQKPLEKLVIATTASGARPTRSACESPVFTSGDGSRAQSHSNGKRPIGERSTLVESCLAVLLFLTGLRHRVLTEDRWETCTTFQKFRERSGGECSRRTDEERQVERFV